MKKDLPLLPSSPEVGAEARRVVRNCFSAAVGTTDRTEGYAYTSLSSIGLSQSGCPIFLWSTLSEHTQNLAVESRVSVLCEHASHLANPQAGKRVTLVGRIAARTAPEDTQADIQTEQLAETFFSRHPSARMYASFQDFSFYSFMLEKAHYVGGFGRAVWLTAPHYLIPTEAARAFAHVQADLISDINQRWPDLAETLIRQSHTPPDTPRVTTTEETTPESTAGATITAVDADGLDVRHHGRTIRCDFAAPVSDPAHVLDAIMAL